MKPKFPADTDLPASEGEGHRAAQASAVQCDLQQQ